VRRHCHRKIQHLGGEILVEPPAVVDRLYGTAIRRQHNVDTRDSSRLAFVGMVLLAGARQPGNK
jgi:hypothetical protein